MRSVRRGSWVMLSRNLGSGSWAAKLSCQLDQLSWAGHMGCPLRSAMLSRGLATISPRRGPCGTVGDCVDSLTHYLSNLASVFLDAMSRRAPRVAVDLKKMGNFMGFECRHRSSSFWSDDCELTGCNCCGVDGLESLSSSNDNFRLALPVKGSRLADAAYEQILEVSQPQSICSGLARGTAAFSALLGVAILIAGPFDPLAFLLGWPLLVGSALVSWWKPEARPFLVVLRIEDCVGLLLGLVVAWCGLLDLAELGFQKPLVSKPLLGAAFISTNPSPASLARYRMLHPSPEDVRARSLEIRVSDLRAHRYDTSATARASGAAMSLFSTWVIGFGAWRTNLPLRRTPRPCPTTSLRLEMA